MCVFLALFKHLSVFPAWHPVTFHLLLSHWVFVFVCFLMMFYVQGSAHCNSNVVSFLPAFPLLLSSASLFSYQLLWASVFVSFLYLLNHLLLSVLVLPLSVSCESYAPFILSSFLPLTGVAASSFFTSGKYAIDPELRGTEFERITQNLDVHFWKTFWNITETEVLSVSGLVGASFEPHRQTHS